MTKRPAGRPWRPETKTEHAIVFFSRAMHAVFFVPLELSRLIGGKLKLDWVLLDMLAIPGSVLRLLFSAGPQRTSRLGLKINALYHICFLCRFCPPARRALRDPLGKGCCIWRKLWRAGDFSITPHFGLKNLFTQYLGKTDLEDFTYLARKK